MPDALPLIQYPSTLLPTSQEKFLVQDEEVEVPVVSLIFKPWAGIPIGNTFGGKPLVDIDGKPGFAELAIYDLALKAGWFSRWIETYAMKGGVPYCFTAWEDVSLTGQAVDPISDPYVAEQLKSIADQNDNSYSGCWDVIAWKGKDIIFMESKRHKKDRVRSTQLRWLAAGLKAGFTPENFMFVQWELEPQP